MAEVQARMGYVGERLVLFYLLCRVTSEHGNLVLRDRDRTVLGHVVRLD